MAKTSRLDDSQIKKNTKKGALSSLVSATFGTTLREWAEAQAKTLPPDHPLRTSPFFRRGFPAITTFVENVTEDLPFGLDIVIEQILSAANAFQNVVESGRSDGTATKAAPKDANAVIGDKLMQQFINGITKRLQEAPVKATEMQAIREELQLLKDLCAEINPPVKEGVKIEPPSPHATALDGLQKFDRTLAEDVAPRLRRFADLIRSKG